LRAEQPGAGVEDVDAVLDQDAAAHLPVPEPVVGAEVLVAGQVLEGEAAGRAEQLTPQPVQQRVQGVAAQHVVDREAGRARPGGRPQHLGGVLQPRRQRLLAEHVPAGGQRVQHQPGVAGRRGGDRHHPHPAVGEQPLRRDGVQAVGGGQRRGALGVPVGDRHRLEARQLPGGVQDRRPEAPAPDQAEPESRSGPRRAGGGQ
jgi:hypothetical protein